MKHLIILILVGWMLMKVGVNIFKGNDFEADYMPYSEYHDVVGDRFQGQDRRGGDRGDYSEYHYQAPGDDSALYYRGRSKRTGRYVSR